MRRALSLTLAGLALVPAVATAKQPTTGRLLVAYDDAATATAASDGKRIARTRTAVVTPAKGESLRGLAERLRRNPRVASVREEQRHTLRYVPNDPGYSTQETGAPAGTTTQWWLQRSNFPAAWDINKGPTALVAVIDTGVDATHPDLAGRVAGSADFDDDPSHGPATTDEIGHGTHVASLACAGSDNAIGIAGAGFGCRLLVAKSDLTESSIARAIIWATDSGAHAINMSFGTDGSRPAAPVVVQALEYAMSRDVVLVAAAADEETEEQGDPSNVLQPSNTGPDADLNKGLSITAATAADQRAGFAGRGTQITMAAYGAYGSGGPPGLLGAFPANETELERGSFVPPSPACRCRATFDGDTRWAYLQGTSMASPQVAAAGALARTLNPDLSGAEVVGLLKGAARRTTDGWNPETGWGILDAGATLAAAAKVDRRAPRSKLTGPASTVRGRTFTLRWSGSDRAPNSGVQASGIARYEVWRSIAGRPAKRFRSTTAKRLVVTGRRGTRYSFFTVAVDRAGNREAAPRRPDARVRLAR